MASMDKIEVIRIYTTPEELRKLADIMEEFWSKLRLGENCTARIWIDNRIEIRFVCDQDRMKKD